MSFADTLTVWTDSERPLVPRPDRQVRTCLVTAGPHAQPFIMHPASSLAPLPKTLPPFLSRLLFATPAAGLIIIAEIEAAKALHTPNDVEVGREKHSTAPHTSTSSTRKRRTWNMLVNSKKRKHPSSKKVIIPMCAYPIRAAQDIILTASHSRDPFPINPDDPEETHQLTVRALVVGAALGCVGEPARPFVNAAS